MSSLSITLVQSDIVWENASANLKNFDRQLENQNTGDIIILPEMFNTGFSMNAEKLAPEAKATLEWMKEKAHEKGALVMGSMIVKEKDNYFNRMYWVFPDGSFGYYDKVHPFRMMEEDKYFAAGKSRKVFEWKGWKILPLICYDLRFPKLSLNRYDGGAVGFDYDLLVYVGNWPAARISAWDTLLKARAMENSAYVASVNRIGSDINGISFNGHSNIYDPRGDQFAETFDVETVTTIVLDKKNLEAYREKFPTHLDWGRYV